MTALTFLHTILRQTAGFSLRLALLVSFAIFSALPAHSSYGLEAAQHSTSHPSRRHLLLAEGRSGEQLAASQAAAAAHLSRTVLSLVAPPPTLAAPRLCLASAFSSVLPLRAPLRRLSLSLRISRGPPAV